MTGIQDHEAKTAARAQMASIYADLVANIKVTDDLSFKLLGTVPLVSGIGSGALTLLEKSGRPLPAVAVIALSLVGCTLTIGLFIWELRNIQKCDWFISRAAKLEAQMFPGGDLRQFAGMARQMHVDAETMNDIRIASLSDHPWGKTQAEKLIYTTAIVAWLIPAAVSIALLVGSATP